MPMMTEVSTQFKSLIESLVCLLYSMVMQRQCVVCESLKWNCDRRARLEYGTRDALDTADRTTRLCGQSDGLRRTRCFASVG